jgi:DNA-binding CsgD family transcriptional regulator
VTSRPDAAVLRQRVSAIARSESSDRALRLAALDELARAVPFQAYAWVLTDPVTQVGAAPLADVPCPSEVATLIRLKYQTRPNRWTSLRTGAVRSLRATTGGRLEHSLLWRDLLARYGVVDVASAVFRDRYGCWSFLDLWRISPAPPFDDSELRALGGLGEVLAGGLRRAVAATMQRGSPAVTSAAGDGPTAVLLLSRDLEIRSRTADTEHYLAGLVPPPPGAAAVPAGALNVAAQLLAVEAGVDTNPPRTRAHLGDGLWLTLSASTMDEISGASIAVVLQQTSTQDRLDLFRRACALSPREGQLLGTLGQGADTRGIARALGITEDTVQDHLASIFAKTGTRSRTELLARAVGD